MLKKIIFFFVLSCSPLITKADEWKVDTIRTDSVIFSSEFNSYSETPSVARWKLRLVDYLKRNAGENNKVVAAILAFPIFGIVGLHRIYLGTKPYVPVVYIATLGGCGGILPLIDFFAIVFSNKETFECYKENPNVFMWMK